MKISETFLKLVAVLFTITAFSLLTLQSNLFLGSVLWLIRWPLLVVGVLLFYRLRKRETKLLVSLMALSWFGILGQYLAVNTSAYEGEKLVSNQTFSLLSYNLYYKNKHGKASAEKILNEDADILCLQEITLNLKNSFDAVLGHKYPYKKIIPLERGYGIGVYSKYPISDHNILYNSKGLPYAQLIKIKVGRKLLRVVNTHLASPSNALRNYEHFFELYKQNYHTRISQLEAINKHISSEKYDCVILTGDLNTPQYEPLFQDLNQMWYDLRKTSESSYKATFPNLSKIPAVLNLDHIMLRGKFEGRSFSVVEGGSSDHLAVKGLIAI